MTTYNKLVRDKIPEILDGKGVVYEKRIASQDDFKFELIKKLDEEISEFKEAFDIDELADVLEVVEALKKLPEYANVESVRIEKWKEKGGFDKKIILSGEK